MFGLFVSCSVDCLGGSLWLFFGVLLCGCVGVCFLRRDSYAMSSGDDDSNFDSPCSAVPLSELFLAG